MWLCAALAPESVAVANANYAEQAGTAAGVYRDETRNFALDLADTPYVVVDFSEQMPDAAFAAMRFDPLVFTMTIVEDLGFNMTAEQYSDIVRTATLTNLREKNAGIEPEITEIGKTEVDGKEAVQLAFSGDINGVPTNYVITSFVKGRLAYQLTAFASRVPAEVVKKEADSIVAAFSFLGESPQPAVVAKRIDAYRSEAFAYEVAADAGIWFPWAELEDDYLFADMGALSGLSYGAVVMPFSASEPTQP